MISSELSIVNLEFVWNQLELYPLQTALMVVSMYLHVNGTARGQNPKS